MPWFIIEWNKLLKMDVHTQIWCKRIKEMKILNLTLLSECTSQRYEWVSFSREVNIKKKPMMLGNI